MKICSKCERQLSENEFGKNQRYCRECKKAYYKANSTKIKAQVRQATERRRQPMRELMLERMVSGCVDCGLRDPRALDFDHVIGKKLAGISELVRSGGTLDEFKVELAKCEVRCKNCHAIVTATRRGNNWFDKYSPA